MVVATDDCNRCRERNGAKVASEGDSINVLLSCARHNLRLIMKRLRDSCAQIFCRSVFGGHFVRNGYRRGQFTTSGRQTQPEAVFTSDELTSIPSKIVRNSTYSGTLIQRLGPVNCTDVFGFD